jgi:hypothetical protein
MEYHLGFVLYVEAAHGLVALNEVFAQRQGDTAPDFLHSYKRTAATMALEDRYELRASAYAPSGGDLPAWPTAGPTVSLNDTRSLRYVLYLPAGQWRVEPIGDAGTDMELRIGDEVSGRARTGAPGIAGQVGIDLEVGRWNTLELNVLNARPDARLAALRVHPATSEARLPAMPLARLALFAGGWRCTDALGTPVIRDH